MYLENTNISVPSEEIQKYCLGNQIFFSPAALTAGRRAITDPIRSFGNFSMHFRVFNQFWNNFLQIIPFEQSRSSISQIVPKLSSVLTFCSSLAHLMDHQMDRVWGRGGAASVTDGELLISNLNHWTKEGIVGRKKWKIRIVRKKVEFLRSTFLNKVRLRGTSPIFRTNLVHPMLLSRNKITKSIVKMPRRRMEYFFINSIATYPTF